MPKAILEFNLPEENEEFKTATQAMDYNLVLWDLDQYLRGKLKYSQLTVEQGQIYEELRDKLHEFLNERNIEL